MLTGLNNMYYFRIHRFGRQSVPNRRERFFRPDGMVTELEGGLTSALFIRFYHWWRTVLMDVLGAECSGTTEALNGLGIASSVRDLFAVCRPH